MADATNKLLITAVDGTTLSFACNPDYLMNNAAARFTGFMHDPAMTFVFELFTRKRLADLEPVAGLNVRQTINRAGRIQLTSDKPCKFVRCRWDSPRTRGYEGWEESSRIQQILGVLEITTATVQGLNETLALTLKRGDWLYKRDGTIERFPDG